MTREEIITHNVLSDYELIDRVRNGEKRLYAVLVHRYNQSLYRMGMSILNNEAEVEDAMQATYIHAYENLRQFEFRSGFRTWITKILIHECQHRYKSREKSVGLNEEKYEDMMLQKEKDESPAVKFMNGELKSILNHVIYSLPEIYRTVFILREIEHLSTEETQHCLNISEANVKVRLNRAKAMLRELLTAYYKEEELPHIHQNRYQRMLEAVTQHQQSSLKEI